jgi:hypothetical protein
MKKTLLFLASLFLSFNLLAWDKIKDCDFGNMIIEKNNQKEYRLTIQGKALDYLIEREALSQLHLNQNGIYQSLMTQEQGHFEFTIDLKNKKRIFYSLYDYGHISMIAKNSLQNDGIDHEVAAWNYRYCRSFN